MPTYQFGEGTGSDCSGKHKDSGLDVANPNAAYGSAQNFLVGDPTALGGGTQCGMQQFYLSALPGRETVKLATLRLFLAANDTTGDRTIDLYRVTTPWGVTAIDEGVDENPATGGQATYSRALDFGGIGDHLWVGGAGFIIGDDTINSHSASFIVHGADIAGTQYDIDVTTMVAGWHGGAWANYGWLFCFIAMAMEFAAFHSQEAVDPALRPVLFVTTSSGRRRASAFGIGIGI